MPPLLQQPERIAVAAAVGAHVLEQAARHAGEEQRLEHLAHDYVIGQAEQAQPQQANEGEGQAGHAALVELAPSAGSIHVNFSCIGGDTLALEDSVGHTAWVVRRNPNDLIRWVVPPNVTINSIKGINFPVDTEGVAGPHGHAPGVPYNAKVSPNASNGRYHYVIDATCRSAPTDSTRLLIDPEFIVPL